MKPEVKASQGLYWRKFKEGNRLNLILGSLLCVISAGASIAIAFLLQALIDVANGGGMEELKQTLLLAAALAAATVLIEFLKRHFIHSFYYRGLVRYKAFVFARILERDEASFGQSQTGQYISGLSNDVNAIEAGYLENIFNVILWIALFVGGLAALAWFNLILFACVLVGSLLPILVSLLFGGRVQRSEELVSAKNDSYVSQLRDMLAGFSVIKSFQAEAQVRRLFEEKNRELETAKRKKRNQISNIVILSTLSGSLLLFIVFGVGAYLAIRGVITAGTVVGCIQILNYVNQPIQQLPPALSRIKAARALVDKMEQNLETGQGQKGSREHSSFDRALRFQNLSFGYEKDKPPVLRDLNLSLEKGKSYALVGVSGSGKSTLLRLLMGQYRDYSGSLTLDGLELRELKASSLYSLMSIIQQNVFIFDDDIRANVTMYKDFPQGEINAALERSGLNALAADKGQDYRCGEGGARLSGGERQRVSIARALLKKTPILLMDEATAALDNFTAARVEEEILSLRGLTRVVVTHKLSRSLLERYDSIIVLRDGTVAEQGSFQQLMERNSYFAALYSVSEASEQTNKQSTTENGGMQS